MSIFFLPALPLAIPYILGGLDFLRRQLFPPAPSTSGAAAPYTPPFSGGQCEFTYDGNTQITLSNMDGSNQESFLAGTFNNVQGKIIECNYYQSGDNIFLRLRNDKGFSINQGRYGGKKLISQSLTITPHDSANTDNCGSLPNPNPPPAIGGDGIANSPAPNLDANGLKVVDGGALAPLPNLGALVAAAVAAAKAAANALDAIKSIADAINAIKDLLKKLNDKEKEKDAQDKADTYRYEFGSISMDGFLRLYPDANTNKYKAEQLDINVLSIPIGYGKYFGSLSPNFYRFKSLGYISFVSPTFGIMEYKQIEFSRMSFVIPKGAIGFYYHLGLNGAIMANAWAYYTKPKPVEKEDN